ncbi:MFS transporter [Nonomuraea sp. NPDC026600]|uniref:MFS transporter n=1 Tax=Nonomuraea sp. NPDC026600 TaxID=3155363 RepID=UPI0033C498AD
MASIPADQPPLTTTDQRTTDSADLPKVNATFMWLIVLATFGSYMALVTPIAISLAIKVSQIAPGHEEYLGYITGAGATASLLATPVTGMLSDRTRSRLGRRRPYLIGLTVLGVGALFVLAEAPNVFMLGLGWVLASIGWGSVMGMLNAAQADRLPESQRGRVAGLTGMVQQLAPVTGAMVAGTLARDSLLLFLVPGAVGAVALALFIWLVPEPDSRELPRSDERFSARMLVRPYLFNPRQVPDFAWNWVGRLLFMAGITFYSTFTAFFLAARLGMSVEQAAGLVGVFAIGGIAAAMIGAVGGGFLSDKLRRRRIFVLLGGAAVAAGAATMALSSGLPLLIGGALLGNLGIGLFSSVDGALSLDVLPDRETDAGRYTGINGLSGSLAQGLAPFVAPVFLAIGSDGGEKNYPLIYLVAGAFTLAGGLVVLLRVKSVR